VPGKDLRIDREPALGYRAVPDFVVAPSLPLEAAAALFQKPLNFRGIVPPSGRVKMNSFLVSIAPKHFERNFAGFRCASVEFQKFRY
jgi:hypothetical protein